MDVTIVQNIAADTAWIIENRIGDKRRSAPFMALSERSDASVAAELEKALQRTIASLRVNAPAVADEVDECLARLRRELGRE